MSLSRPNLKAVPFSSTRRPDTRYGIALDRDQIREVL
jgi:hypothetical protein